MASVDFFHFNYSSKNNGFEMVKEALLDIFRTEKNLLYLRQLFIFKYKLTYHQKKSKDGDGWCSAMVWEKYLKS